MGRDKAALRKDMNNRRPPLPPLGHIMLTVCAYLAPDSIPRSLLQRWLAVAYPDTPVGVDLCSVVLGLLRDYSLLQFTNSEKSAVKVHRVLRAVVRHQHESVEPDRPREEWYPLPGLQWMTVVVRAVNAEYERKWEHILERQLWHRQLLPHLDLLASTAPPVNVFIGEEEASLVYALLLRNAAEVFLYDLGQYGQGQKYLMRALPLYESVHGPHHSEVAATLTNLGVAHGSLGDYCKQKELLERALVIQEATYGPNHVHVAATLMNLGNSYGSLGDSSKKRKLLERALAIEEATYGSDHIGVAATLTNLGVAHGQLGDCHKQQELIQRALTIKEAAYGPHHASVAITLKNLGVACGALGDYSKMRELLERALMIDEATYGPHHSQVAMTLTNLGTAYGSLGNFSKMREMLQRALMITDPAYDPTYTEMTVPNSGPPMAVRWAWQIQAQTGS